MTSDTIIGEEHLQAARDGVLGLDPSQAPTDPDALNERLSLAQDELTRAIQVLIKASKAKHLSRTLPLAYAVVEAANRAHPEKMKAGLKSKLVVASIAAVAAEARQLLSEGAGTATPTRERQPVLAKFLDQALLAPGALPSSMPLDERVGLVALALGTLRAVDRHLAGAEQPVTVKAQPGRNDPCHCGSGKKFKKCHGA